MQISFAVYGLRARVEQDLRGSESVAIKFREFGTHHAFIARFRDPARFVEMLRELEDLAKKKGWDINPPAPRADTHTDLNDHRQPEPEGHVPCSEEEDP